MLQPVVENAVTHGIANDPKPGRISISAHRVDGALHLTVADSGPGFGGSRCTAAAGMGLSNGARAARAAVRRGAGGDDAVQASHGGAAVDIVMPYREP